MPSWAYQLERTRITWIPYSSDHEENRTLNIRICKVVPIDLRAELTVTGVVLEQTLQILGIKYP